MTSTSTKTTTRTETRTLLLRAQLEVAARVLAPDADRVIDFMIRPGLAEGFLSRLDFYALDSAGAAHARLSLGVNWEEHRALLTSTATVRLNAGWRDLTAPAVQVAIDLFEEAVTELNATVKVLLIPTPTADREELGTRYRLNASKRPGWAVAAEPTLAPFSVRELSELRIELASTHLA